MSNKVKYIGLACVLLTGCTMGPDFTSPPAATPPSWFRNSNPSQLSQPVEGAEVDPHWWNSLNDPMLNQLVARLVAENLDVQTATTRLEESRAQRGVTASDIYPQVNGDGSYTREKLSDKGVISLVGGSGGTGASGGAGGAIPNSQATPAFNIYQAGFDVSWELDLWGRVRRGIEAADANVLASEEARRATLISSIAELVRDYVQLRGAQATIEVTQKSLDDARGILKLTKERVKAGLANDIDLDNAAAQAAATDSQLSPLEQQKASLMNAIALLLAQPPGSLESDLSQSHPIPPIPPKVPLGVPSELLERRPDIRQAEDQLHAATAEIGVAKADFFPRVTLMGDGMLQSLDLSDLGTWAARAYTLGPSITLPIFEGGRLTSTLELRNAQQREAGLQYKKTVLTAFHEVDNALTAYRAEQQRREALAMAVEANSRALTLAVSRYKQGLSNFVDVLTDEQNLLNAQQQNIQSTQMATTNMVELYKALGGGWEIEFPVTTK